MSATDQAPAYDCDSKSIAARYGCSAKHITNLAVAGTIPGLRVGSNWRFNRDEVHAAFTKATEDAWKRRKPTTPQPKGGGL